MNKPTKKPTVGVLSMAEIVANPERFKAALQSFIANGGAK